MAKLDSDREHLYRLAALFAIGILLFLGVRTLMVPANFGEYGHFRPAALGEIASLPVVLAGRHACAECHADAAKTLAGGKHLHLGCESCHGPLAAHAGEPKKVSPAKVGASKLCLGCHLVNSAKPAKFPQIDPKSHEDGECLDCHEAHSPGLD